MAAATRTSFSSRQLVRPCSKPGRRKPRFSPRKRRSWCRGRPSPGGSTWTLSWRTASPKEEGDPAATHREAGSPGGPRHRILLARPPRGWQTELVLPLMAAADQNAFSSLSAASIVSVSALLFTVASFWWLNARQGRLESWEPHSFAAIVRGSMIRLRLPLVLHNSGAKPIIVQDLRLSFPDEPASHLPLLWTSSASRLQPGPDEESELPTGFVVAGRDRA